MQMALTRWRIQQEIAFCSWMQELAARGYIERVHRIEIIIEEPQSALIAGGTSVLSFGEKVIYRVF